MKYPSGRPARDRIASLPIDGLHSVKNSVKNGRMRNALPHIYRTHSGAWQCEWDDMTEIGAFRSRILGRAVRKAQRARAKQVLRYIADLIGGAS